VINLAHLTLGRQRSVTGTGAAIVQRPGRLRRRAPALCRRSPVSLTQPRRLRSCRTSSDYQWDFRRAADAIVDQTAYCQLR